MCDNRTNEFRMLVQTLPPSVTGMGSGTTTSRFGGGTTATTNSSLSSVNGNTAAKGATANQQTELRQFHQTAAGISRDIASTSALLTELTDLVRHQNSAGSFESSQATMNQLVVRIKTNIENLNSRLDQASRQIQQQKKRVGQQAGEEASNIVDGLKTVFAEAANDFKKVLQQRTESLKEQSEFQKQVYDYNNAHDDDPIPNLSLSTPPPVYGSSYGASASNNFPTLDLTSGLMAAGEASGVLPRPHGISYVSGANSGSTGELRRRHPPDHQFSASSYGSYTTGPPLTPLDIQRQEEEMGLQMQLIPDQDYLQQRADAMATVESNIVELGAIFNKLAVMVSEHRDLVQRVDDNVQDAQTNINLSMNALTDTLTSLRTNRMLALRVFSVLVLFIIMFIVFFA